MNSFYIYCRFNRAGYYNDIAILVLDRLVRKSKYIIPLCLPIGKYMLPKARLVGRRATVVGWGSTYYGGVESVKEQQADMPIWTNEECDQAYFQPILDMFICAGFRAGGVDACQVIFCKMKLDYFIVANEGNLYVVG